MSQHAVLSAGCKAWRSLLCPQSELWLDLTLGCGQTFRWRETADGHYTGVMQGKVWTLTQTENTLWYYVYGQQMNPGEKNECKVEEEKRSKGMIDSKLEEGNTCTVMSDFDAKDEKLLRDYFQLDVKLGDLYRDWRTADPHFKEISDVFTGVRMLRQDPGECLFSFICSSNNHISRIQGMIDRLCQTLGTPLCTLNDVAYHDFPPLHVLADVSVEMHLRDLGFGYRARFLQQSAQVILNTHGPEWLQSLRSAPYLQARDALRSLPGVGLKVADCVCLMSLDKSEAVPVDTHVWQISRRDYKCAAGSSQKSLTDKVYKEIVPIVVKFLFPERSVYFDLLSGPSFFTISCDWSSADLKRRNVLFITVSFSFSGDFFRNLWGPYAGWAQSVVFCADLKRFQKLKDNIPVLKDEMKDLKNIEKRKDTDEENRKKRKKRNN